MAWVEWQEREEDMKPGAGILVFASFFLKFLYVAFYTEQHAFAWWSASRKPPQLSGARVRPFFSETSRRRSGKLKRPCERPEKTEEKRKEEVADRRGRVRCTSAALPSHVLQSVVCGIALRFVGSILYSCPNQ